MIFSQCPKVWVGRLMKMPEKQDKILMKINLKVITRNELIVIKMIWYQEYQEVL